MKKHVLIFLLVFFIIGDLYAQSTSISADSIAYLLQRKKINNMLAVRKLKFGIYSESLNQHTGIFGLQTKSDIRRSNDILMDIVRTDDSIYKELKILLAYRAFQQRQIQGYSKEAEAINSAYVARIKSLVQQNKNLKLNLDNYKQKNSTTNPVFIALIGLMLASILYLLYKRNKVKV